MKKLLLFFVAGALASALLAGCKSSLQVDIRHDLIGHTMGGREKTWKFQSESQIEQLLITGIEGRTYFATLILRGEGRYIADVKIVYNTAGQIESVGLLYIKKL